MVQIEGRTGKVAGACVSGISCSLVISIIVVAPCDKVNHVATIVGVSRGKKICARVREDLHISREVIAANSAILAANVHRAVHLFARLEHLRLARLATPDGQFVLLCPGRDWASHGGCGAELLPFGVQFHRRLDFLVGLASLPFVVAELVAYIGRREWHARWQITEHSGSLLF